MKLLTAETCPHCKKDFESEKDLEQLDLKRNVGTIKEIETPKDPKSEPEVIEKIIEKTKIPSHIPSYKCKDGNCGLTHPNPNYTKQIRGKCANCGQFTGDLEADCPFCNKNEFDELDEDELDDLGIPHPKEPTHEHED